MASIGTTHDPESPQTTKGVTVDIHRHDLLVWKVTVGFIYVSLKKDEQHLAMIFLLMHTGSDSYLHMMNCRNFGFFRNTSVFVDVLVTILMA